jgi:hypothetical protein
LKQISISLAVLLVLSGGIYLFLTHVPPEEDRSGFDIVNWPPSMVELSHLVRTNGADPNTPAGLAARDRYMELFKRRYRTHQPMMAVGIRFTRTGRIDLLTPARMEPWNLDRLAVNTWQETQMVFGHPFDIDLFITYIGSPPLKIGELRRANDSSGKLEIVHYSIPILPQQTRRIAIRR